MDAGTGTSVPHILILEDDAAHRDLILRAFRDDPDRFRLSVIGTIRSAREILERDRPDLILSDWILPDGKGLDILPRTDGFVTIPLIIMTSFGDERLAVEIMKSGAIDYVVKSATMFRDLPHIAKRALAYWENIQERRRAEAAEQETQKRLADILNFLPDAVLAIDNEGKVIGWNHAIERMTGVMAKDMLGKGDHEHSLPFYGVRRPILIDLVQMDDKEIEKKYDFIQRDNGRITTETFIPTLYGGKGAYLWGTASPLFDSAGVRIGAIEVIRNITERKQAEKDLRESEEKYRNLAENVHDGIYIYDGSAHFLFVNHQAAEITGYTEEELLSMNIRDLVHPDDRPFISDIIAKRFGGCPAAETYEVRILRKDGIRRVLEISVSCISYHEQFATLGAARDITDRKDTEHALQESEKKYRYLVDNVRDILWQTTPDLTFTYVSPAAEHLTGYLPEDLIGTSLFAILTEPSAKIIQQRLTERMAEYSHGSRDLATIFEVEVRKKDGGMFWIEISSNAVFDPDGTIAGFQGISRDITERRLAEEKLSESETRFRDLFTNLSSGVVIYDPAPDGSDFIIRDVNHAVETIDKVKKEEIVGRSVLEIFPGVKEFGIFAVFQRVARTGIAEKFPVSMYRDNRIAGWRENFVYRLPSGEIVVLYEDVTEKKQVDEERQRLFVAVQESEERYRSVIENAAEGITVAQDGMLQYANARLLEMTGINPEEITGRPFTDFIHPDDRALVLERYQRRVAGENVPQNYDFRIVGTGGEITWVQLSAVRIEWNGRPATLNFLMDITERKVAEEKLRESRQILEGILNTIPVRVFWKDKNLTYLGCNAPFARDAGFEKPGDIIGKDDYAMGWRDQAGLYQADDRAVIESGNAKLMIEEPQTTPAGDTIYLLTSKLPLRDARGDVIGVLGTYLDITDRKKAEEMLRESEERLLMAQEIGHIGGWEYNLQTNKIWGSAEGARIYGLPPVSGDFPIDTIEACIPERERVHQALVDLIRHGKEYNLEFAVNPADGSPQKVIMSTARLEKDAQGTPVRVVGVIQDITARTLAEAQLRESEERYRILLNSAGIGVGYWSPEGTLLYLNDISYQRIRAKEADVLGKNMRELFGDTADMYLDRLNKAVVSEDPAEYEDYVRLPSGNGWYLSVYNRISRPDGTVAGVQVLSMDITQRKQAEEIRKAYETRLDSAMEIGSLAWWEMDLPGGAVRFDERKATMLGYPPSQFTHYSDFTALLHPDDREPALQAMKDHLEDRQSRYHVDYRIRTAAGDYRWFRDVGGITRHHPDGSPATVTGIVIDITASKAAEEALRATETRYRALIQNSSDIIRILDRDGLIVYESESAERILGYPKGYLIGKNPMEYIHPEDVGHVKKDFGDVIDRINPGKPTEFRIRKADGEYLWVDSIGTNLLDVPGVNGIVITTRPIQQRKEAEQALRESEARLATAMDIAGLVNWQYDVASGMFTFDDRFYALYSTTADREGGYLMSAETYMQEFVHPDDRQRVLSEIQKLLATTDPSFTGQVEHRITPRDGSVRTIIARFAPVMGPGGKVIRTFGANQDITDFKLMESEIRSLNTVLEQRVKDRTDALAKTNEALGDEIAQRQETEKKLQKSYDEKVLLLKEIHHRVKNNLQIIASLLNLQSRYVRDESTLAIIRESQNRVKAMALVHEKLYRSEDIAHISLIDYLRFLGTGLFQFYDAKSRGIQFRLDIHEVNVDINSAIPLGLILNELISNSLKYAFPEGRTGEIAISVIKEEHKLTIIFRDTGIGIPADLDWQNTQSLGLRLVNTLVDQMNGTIELDRSSGTQFTMVMHEKEQREPS